MCGRYTNEAEFSEIRLTFSAEPFERFGFWKPTYNITPSYGAGFEQLIVVGSARVGREIRGGSLVDDPAVLVEAHEGAAYVVQRPTRLPASRPGRTRWLNSSTIGCR